ncbi:hypothetical protein [Edaphobacter aggregans]|jgi:hypothetical protein|uniref:hypothetical protein n=1 Tax=Edaphobacter aggregans TaxID=570835 RepID=UPI00163A1A8A|nr:hypothetical protein [Edaphobacter aggregans]
MKDRILSSRFAKGARLPFRIIKNDQMSILAEIDIDKSVFTAIDSNECPVDQTCTAAKCLLSGEEEEAIGFRQYEFLSRSF